MPFAKPTDAPTPSTSEAPSVPQYPGDSYDYGQDLTDSDSDDRYDYGQGVTDEESDDRYDYGGGGHGGRDEFYVENEEEPDYFGPSPQHGYIPTTTTESPVSYPPPPERKFKQ